MLGPRTVHLEETTHQGCIAYLAVYDNGQTQPTRAINGSRLEYTFNYTNGYKTSYCYQSISMKLSFICDRAAIPYSNNTVCGQNLEVNGICQYKLTIPTYLACIGFED